MWISRQLSWLVQDARHAFRTLRRSPAFTLVAIASLALGIGANTAIFSFVNAVLVQRLPVPEPQQLLAFKQVYRGAPAPIVWPLVTIDELAEHTTALDGLFGSYTTPVSVAAGDRSYWANAELVTGQYFDTLQVTPLAGRLLNGDDVRNAAGNPICVLSYGFWQREFGGDPAAVGRTLSLNGQPYQIVGVAAESFSGTELRRRVDIVIPATRAGDFVPLFAGPAGAERMNTMSWLSPMGRLGEGQASGDAKRQMERLLLGARRTIEVYPDDGSQGFNSMRQSFGRPLLVLMGVVGLVLLMACANLANLLLARAQARSRELALRLSLGASRTRLVRQLFVEFLMLAVGGGVAGVALSVWISNTLLAILNAGRPTTSAVYVTMDANVLAFSIALTCATAILFGLAPAWQATRPDLAHDLKQDPTSSTPSPRMLSSRTLIVAQIALSLMIVFGAGLLTRTLLRLSTVDLGFDPDRVIALSVDPAASGYAPPEAARVLQDVVARARALPGVRAASLTSSVPGGGAITMNVDVPGYTPRLDDRGDRGATFNLVSPGYFETLGQQVLLGRDFDDRDGRDAPRVAIVNERFVQHFFAGRNPVGLQFKQQDTSFTIVGVVADVRGHSVRTEPVAMVYLPAPQGPPARLTLLVRTEADPQPLIASLVEAVGGVDRRMPVFSVRTLDEDLSAGLSSERILGYLLTVFAALAILLAGIGLHGLLSYSISRRTREIGIRFAVGAQRRDVVALFAREGAVLVLAGVGVGVTLALVAARALRGLLFGVTPNDPLTLLVSVAVLVGVAILATATSLWRAAHTNLVTALRYD